MDRTNDSLSIIIKPTTMCNLRCAYCYDASKCHEEVMSNEILEKSISSVLPYYKHVTYIWHGGEPLVLPLSFYDKAFEYQSKYRREGQIVNNFMQSNGSLIDEATAEFIKSKNIGIGISFDGPYNEQVRGCTKETLNGLEHLRKLGGRNIVQTVVGAHNIEQLVEIYNYFKDIDVGVRFSHIFNAGAAKDDKKLLLDEEKYVYHMCELFDIWSTDLNCKIPVLPFEELARIILFNKNKTCTYKRCQYQWIGIESDGSIYPCGRYYPEEYKLGNIIHFDDIRDVFNTTKYQTFVQQAEERYLKCQRSCELFRYCEGGCNNNAILENGLTNIGGFSCITTKKIFLHIQNRLNQFKNEMLTNFAYTNQLLKENTVPAGSPKINQFLQRQIILALAKYRL
ncbi:radical SAM/SPASM domain-containing protein [Flavonifractor sp. An306]|uniref:radical SAM/SPASM domain-containing protein n=1 Tax=Flavonifractor sp. An306 TaxID=1965629 RepID=UPI00174BB6D9|nr:radical SAM protein [Flavonifractor sp. An306]